MYGPLRDVLIHALGYPAREVDIDTMGDGGRPDVTVRAPAGLLTTVSIDWIVVEAKDEHGSFTDPKRRERIYAAKSKYITPNTAWLVMVDPDVIIARPAQAAAGVADITYHLDGTETFASFVATFTLLRADLAGVPERLERFRSGDTTLIAIDRLEPSVSGDERAENVARVNRRTFFATIRESTDILQDACAQAYAALVPKMDSFRALAKEFEAKYGGFRFTSNPLSVSGNPKGPAETLEHNKAANELRREFGKDLTAASLTFEGLPAFQGRTGSDDATLPSLFTAESANLILARIMLVRFLEDHMFFGANKYVCNGGVKAFQKMKDYFSLGYTNLLENAFRSAGKLYAAAFTKTELDWVEQNNNPILSAAIEWSMYQFARYDFTTVRGDTLTGIYDRFLDRRKRKAIGEFFTPPSVARFIIDRVGITANSAVFDPACGSGTFLIEAYEKMIGSAARRGGADWDDVSAVISRIAGNDINSFSSVLTQIQLIWQLLRFRNDLVVHGFPELSVTASNALMTTGLGAPANAFTVLDQPVYDAVVGNPPYIRPERNRVDLDSFARDYFNSSAGGRGGVSPESDTYALFLYKALDLWCKQLTSGTSPGRVGFVMPLALLDNNENERIRKLLELGGRWTILEIVDMEMIWRRIFDAKSIPMIFIAEARPATDGDIVHIRLADQRHVKVIEGAIRPEFDFASMPAHDVPYRQLFTADGRVPTRVNNARRAILAKMKFDKVLRDAAKPFWYRKDGSRIVAWRANAPLPHEIGRWSLQEMFGSGVAFRGKVVKAAVGYEVFKGENVVSGGVFGDPALTHIDISSADDMGLFRYLGVPSDPERPNLFGPVAYAITNVAQTPNLCAFDPSSQAFTNTAQIFVPNDALCAFPFDMLFLSNIYVYWYALVARMGLLDAQRSHIYLTNFGSMPWSDKIAACGARIEAHRSNLVDACRANLKTAEELDAAIKDLNYETVKRAIQHDENLRVNFSETFDVPEYETDVAVGEIKASPDGDGWMVFVSPNLLDYVIVSDEQYALGIQRSLRLKGGEKIDRKGIQNLRVARTTAELTKWDAVVAKFGTAQVDEDMKAALRVLDIIVGTALGLKESDVDDIARDLETDPFLSHVRPRYPGSNVRVQGLRKSLDSPKRYN